MLPSAHKYFNRPHEGKGEFYTVPLDKNDPITAWIIAWGFAARRPRPRALLLGWFPDDVSKGLDASGLSKTRQFGVGLGVERVFYPPTFPILDFYNLFRWGIIPLNPFDELGGIK